MPLAAMKIVIISLFFIRRSNVDLIVSGVRFCTFFLICSIGFS